GQQLRLDWGYADGSTQVALSNVPVRPPSRQVPAQDALVVAREPAGGGQARRGMMDVGCAGTGQQSEGCVEVEAMAMLDVFITLDSTVTARASRWPARLGDNHNDIVTGTMPIAAIA
ncbi:MAG TPA: hypothetical protein VF524_05165, partial [Polyangia bacterium]